jgi:hypothetical protein
MVAANPTPTPALVSPMESPWRLSRQRQPRQQPDASRSRVLAVSSLGPGPRDRESAPHGARRRPVIAGSTMSDTLHPAGRSTVHGAPPLSAFQAGFGLPAGCLRPRAGPVPTAAASIPRRRTTRMGATRSGYLSACPARVAAALRTIGGQSSTFSGARLGGLAVTTASGSPESIMWMQIGRTQEMAVRRYALARATSTYFRLLPPTHYHPPSLADRPAPSHTRCGTPARCCRVCQ